ncbi:hypothetical protein BGX29_009473 [Mortierella sp. GBA35]|nr:hypothetical protein BGX23_011498 [Mortierella sp. AD031]KAF9094510.1 hypothetical protein BGX29_009473 [Mortierella sp. GBA35]
MAALLNRLKKKFDIHVVKHIDLEDMSIDFTGPDHWISTVSSDRLIARLAHIPGFNWPIQKVQLRVIVQDEGKDVGQLESPFSPASVVAGSNVASSITNSTMTIFPDAHAAFAGFISALATQPNHTFFIKGSADIIFNLGPLGVHTINGVDFISDLTLRGLNNLPDVQCTVITEVLPSEGYDLTVKLLFALQNPSQLALTLGDMRLVVSTCGDEETHKPEQMLGILTLQDLKLVQGINEERAGVLVLDTSLDIVREFLKAAATGPRKVYLKGYEGTSANAAIASGLLKLRTTVTIPAFEVPVVDSITKQPTND